MRNNRYLRIETAGYGHKKVTMDYYGKEISWVTTNMPAVDDYNSDPDERDGRELRQKRGYDSLRAEGVRAFKNSMKLR